MILSITAALIASALQSTVQEREPQGVDYRIEARLDESTDILTGRVLLRYTNRSPEALDTLWFHQHLNAFRPNSEWARRDLEQGEQQFQSLGPDEHAFDRFTRLEVDGRSVTPVYPGSPDSTVAAVPLPRRLEAGQTVEVKFDWEARLSTIPRRQGRRGRQYDFAQWYPRIAAYTDEGWQTTPLVRQGEFFGEFGAYDFTVEVAEDQVMAATGVPVEGDPGWEAAARPGMGPISYQRDFYPARDEVRLGLLGDRPAAGLKRLRWRAQDVHHFAWSVKPDFIYEGGSVARTGPEGGTIPIHVLYLPGDVEWPRTVMQRTVAAMDWLQEVLGPYPWPQQTNLRRIEAGGATEYPMMQMNASYSQGLILHETAHQYAHGLLANNEFAEGWLDEGMAEYLTQKFADSQGPNTGWTQVEEYVRQFETARRTEPIATPGAEFSSYGIYSAMTYAKAQLMFRMLEGLIGEDSMRAVLRRYYERFAPGHVDEEAFRTTVGEVTGENLDWFFEQWLHTTAQLDYGIREATTRQVGSGEWETRVVVTRSGDAWMPVTLQVGSQLVRLTARDREQVATVRTAQRPGRAVLDPEGLVFDVVEQNDVAAVR